MSRTIDENTSPNPATLPVPDLDPRGLTLEEYMGALPRKLGLVAGEMVDDPEGERSRVQMLALLLVNTGLVEAVRLAPRRVWLEALERASGPTRGAN